MAPREFPTPSAGVRGARYSGDAGVFVGREQELVTLRAAVDDALAGRGRIVLLAGEPGIGKTRTAQELATDAEQRGMRVLWGRCYEGDGAPAYWPWVQAIRAHVEQRTADELLTLMGVGAAAIAQWLAMVRERLPNLPAPPRLEPEQERFRLFDGLATFLKNVAAEQALMLVLDDLHWADPASLLLLQFLAREIEHAPLMLLATYRDEDVQPGQPLSKMLAELTRSAVSVRIRLGGLGAPDVGRLIQRVAGRKPSDAAVTRIARQTEGNPLFVSEVVRWLVTEGGLEQAAADALGVPPSVREVIGRRLDRLSPACSEVLRIAAVVGRDFSPALLTRVSGLPQEQLLDRLDEAVTARALMAAPRAAGYSFAHALIRETLYADLSTVRRLRLHQQIGEALETLHAAHLEPHLSELAYHFGQTASLGDAHKAIEYGRRAGARATASLAYEDAVAHYERALHACELSAERSDRERAELLLALGDARYKAGLIREAQEAFERTAALSRQLAAPDLLARTALSTGSGWVYVEGLDELRYRLLEEASRALPRNDSALRALVLAWLARSLYQRPDAPERRIALSHEAVDMARRVGAPQTLLLALNCAYQALWQPDTVERRMAIAAEEVELAAELGDPVSAVLAHLDLVCSCLDRGDIRGVDREMAIYNRLATELRDPSHLRYVGSLGVMRALLVGEFHRVRDLVRQFHAAALKSHDRDAETTAGRAMIALERETGNLERRVSAVVGIVEQFPDSWEARGWLSFVYAATGRIDDARREFDRLATRDFADLPRNWVWLDMLSRLAEVCTVLGDVRRAKVLYNLMRPYDTWCIVHADGLLCQGAVARYLGLLASTTQNWEAAAEHFEQAIALHTRMGARPWLAHTLADFGAMLLNRGTRDDATRALAFVNESINIATQLGMSVLLEKAQTLRQRAEGMAGGDRIDAEAATPTHTASPTALLRNDGDYWMLVYEDTNARLKDSKGLQYLAHLLRHPSQEFHVLDLIGRVSGVGGRGTRDQKLETRDQGLPILDGAAKADYGRRVMELREELAEAEQFNDAGRVERLRAEIEAITEQLASAVGLGGRDRTALAVTERARSTVTQRIKTAIKRISGRCPALAAHLADRVKTGTFCVYRPDPNRPIRWRLDS